MTSVLVDSDILIEVSRGRNQAVVARWEQLSGAEHAVLYSPVSAAELWHGALPHEYRVLDALFAALICVPISAEIGKKAGAYLREFRKSHHVELGDALIAATASLHDLALWTRNRRHYPMKDLNFY